MSCGLGHRHSSDLAWLWLWQRAVAKVTNGSIASQTPYAESAALKSTKNIYIYIYIYKGNYTGKYKTIQMHILFDSYLV